MHRGRGEVCRGREEPERRKKMVNRGYSGGDGDSGGGDVGVTSGVGGGGRCAGGCCGVVC